LAFCLGNCDLPRAEALEDAALVHGARFFRELGRFNPGEQGAIAFCHFPALARNAAASGNYSAVFFGHTHRRAWEKVRLDSGAEVLLANPGDIEGRYAAPGGLVYDTVADALTWV
jgi:predicted phosphodiesterase